MDDHQINILDNSLNDQNDDKNNNSAYSFTLLTLVITIGTEIIALDLP